MTSFDDFKIKDGVLLEYRGGGTRCEIPDGVLEIAEGAFSKCSRLEAVAIPRGVTKIDECAFSGCGALRSFEVSPENTRYKCDGSCLIEVDGGRLIRGGMNSIIPDDGSVAVICRSAFDGCEGLVSIAIPSSVKFIDYGAFSACGALEVITVDEGNPIYRGKGNAVIEREGARLICGCKSTVIPDGGEVLEIGFYAFLGCEGMQHIAIPSGVKVIGNSAFSRCGLRSVEFPDTLEDIGDYAFADTQSLTKVVVPSGVKRIGYNAFSGCGALREIEIPDTVTFIGKEAFDGCTRLVIRAPKDSYAAKYVLE